MLVVINEFFTFGLRIGVTFKIYSEQVQIAKRSCTTVPILSVYITKTDNKLAEKSVI
jgi:hypothetical protein